MGKVGILIGCYFMKVLRKNSRRMDTNLGCSDVWNLLGGQALVMICRWYSR